MAQNCKKPNKGKMPELIERIQRLEKEVNKLKEQIHKLWLSENG